MGGRALYGFESMAELVDLLVEKVPVPSFLSLNSSKVGSHTMSSHIWQYREAVLESTSAPGVSAGMF